MRLSNCSAMKKNSKFIVLLALLNFTVPASAQPQLRIELSSTEQVTSQNNQGASIVRYIDSDTVQPGARIAYRITYTNEGNEAANRASLTGVIPENALFLEVLEADPGTEIRFSADQAQSFDFPPFSFTTVDDNGTEDPPGGAEIVHEIIK